LFFSEKKICPFLKNRTFACRFLGPEMILALETIVFQEKYILLQSIFGMIINEVKNRYLCQRSNN